MANILIVDDEFSKPSAIFELASSIDSDIQITHVTTSREARLKTLENTFDLLLIDINLPASLGASPSTLGGMELYDLIILDTKSNIPLDIVFITEKEDSIETYIVESSKRGTSLCRFEASNDGWRIFMLGKLNLMLNRKKRLERSSPTADIAIITALNTPELDAVLNLPYKWQMRRFVDDPTSYHFGTKERGDNYISIVAASAMRKGMSSSSSLAMKMVERFRPKFIVMLGICVGVKDKVSLGDVIVANPTWDWGSGKLSQDDMGSEIFLSAPHQLPLEQNIYQLTIDICRDPYLTTKIKSGWSKESPTEKLVIHIGPLASGSMVLASDKALEPITTQNRDVIGVDMEAYAVMAASDYSRLNKLESMVIKSVSDFADSKKDKSWQEYASYTSAAFFDILISDEYFPL